LNESAAANQERVGTGPQRRGYVRWLVRGLLFLALAFLLLPRSEAWPAAVVVPALSPLVAFASMLATRTIHLTASLGLAVAAIALLRRRWFCRWVCPTGLAIDGAGRLGLVLGRRGRSFPSLGPWIALVTLGGACLGYPLLLWLDPLAMFSGPFSLLSDAPGPGRWCASGFVAVVLLSVAWPGVWCMRVCPLGAVQDLLWLPAKALRSAIERRGRPTPPRSQPALAKAYRALPRRVVLGTAAGLVWAAAARVLHAKAPRCLRPPGALEETRFVGLCIRCGNCARACPERIIRPDLGEHGIAGLLAPVVEFRDDSCRESSKPDTGVVPSESLKHYCREDCTRCTEVCPSGALVPLAADDKPTAVIGLARVDMNLCLLGDDRDCAVCRTWCPYEAITLEFSEAEYTLTPRIDPRKCPGCGACEVYCPTTPDKAIVVYPR
jgi:ferredoxin